MSEDAKSADAKQHSESNDSGAETLCGDPDCPVCSSPMSGTCADGFSAFVDALNGGSDDE